MVPVSNAYPRATSSISTGPAGAVVAGTVVSTGDGEVGSPVVDVGVTVGDVGSAVCVVGTIVGVGVTGPGLVVQPARSRQATVSRTSAVAGTSILIPEVKE